nr:MAG TPA: hypothetical protein [Caudoviricetes sp.]
MSVPMTKSYFTAASSSPQKCLWAMITRTQNYRQQEPNSLNR